MYIFCPLTNTFLIADAHPIIVSHDYLQPNEVTLLEHIHKIKLNHKLYKLIENTNHELSTPTEEENIIRALEFVLVSASHQKHNPHARLASHNIRHDKN